MLSASMPSASSMTIASRTIVVRLRAGCSDLGWGRAHTDGIGFCVALSVTALLGAYVVRIQRTAIESCEHCSVMRTVFAPKERCPHEVSVRNRKEAAMEA